MVGILCLRQEGNFYYCIGASLAAAGFVQANHALTCALIIPFRCPPIPKYQFLSAHILLVWDPNSCLLPLPAYLLRVVAAGLVRRRARYMLLGAHISGWSTEALLLLAALTSAIAD